VLAFANSARLATTTITTTTTTHFGDSDGR